MSKGWSEAFDFSRRFTQLCQELQDGGDHVTLSEKFGKLKNNEERIKFAYGLPAFQRYFEVPAKSEAKSTEESNLLRSTGNDLFKKKRYQIALHYYTKSILFAPFQSKELSLAFANRSAVLYHIRMYRLCLEDIAASLKYGYPDELRYKLLDRKARCCFCLGRTEEATTAAKDVEDDLQKSNLDIPKRSKWSEDLKRALFQTSNADESSSNEPKYFWPLPERKDTNTKFPCATAAFDLVYTPEKGRYAVATRDIEIGEVVITEEPYAAMLLKPYTKTHCDFCLVRSVAPVPCRYCSGVVYCNEHCRDCAWSSYHKTECNYLEVLLEADIGLGRLALRMVLTAGLEQVLSLKNKKMDIKDETFMGCNRDGVYRSDDYWAAYALVNHQDNRTVGDLFRRTVMATMLLKLLQQTEFLNSVSGIQLSEDNVFYVGSQILRHIMMLPCNAHEISELVLVPGQLATSRTAEIGSGLYNTLSLVNHSCDPSVMRQSYGRRCVTRAIRFIRRGEEIADNYGALCALSTRLERNAHLSSQYFFECSCEACVKNWPQYFDIPNEVPVIKCKSCSGRVFVPMDGLTDKSVCSDCQMEQDITHTIVCLKHSGDIFQGALQKVLQGEDLLESLPLLLGHLRLLEDTVCRPWREYNDCQEAIKQIYNTMGNCFTQNTGEGAPS
ncbi:SET and MYND domain-containing protein 4-like [Liolophura sinensis]|uniref:SET and MYND domain-containing protein 4-like n=1 Tax=Liolophura sinensis TaxID=3198878 RepID=UPI003158A1C2